MEPQTNNETSSKTSDCASVNNLAFLLTKRNLDGNSLRHRGTFNCNFKLINPGKSYTQKIQSSPSFISHLDLKAKLVKHHGCVNTIRWNEEGTLLITGSDDCDLNIWRGGDYKLVKNIISGHIRNIFSAEFVPGSNDQRLVSCGMDGEVRLFDLNSKQSKLLGHWDHLMLYKIVFLPNDVNSFITTHQDGYIRKFDLRTEKYSEVLKITKALSAAFCPINPNYFIVGGGDPFARLYDIRMSSITKDLCIRKFCPEKLLRERNSYCYITGVDFNSNMEILVNYSGDDVYLFDTGSLYTNNLSKSPTEKETVTGYLQVYSGRRNIQTFLKEVAFMGNNSYVTTGGDCGNVYIWEKTSGDLVQLLQGDRHVVNGVAPHPKQLPILATCGIDHDGKIFEVGDKVFDKKKAKDTIERNSVHDDEDYAESRFGGLSLSQLWRIFSSLRSGNQSPIEEEEESEEDILAEASEIRSEGNTQFSQQQYPQALEFYERSLQVLSRISNSANSRLIESKLMTMSNKALCLLKLKQFDRCIEECNAILQIQPQHLKAIFRRAQAYFEKGMLDRALEDATKAHELSPQDKIIKDFLEEVQTAIKGSKK